MMSFLINLQQSFLILANGAKIQTGNNMTIKNKMPVLFICTVILSGCTVSSTTTKTFDDKGRVKTTEKIEVSKNTATLQGLGAISAAIFLGKTETGAALVSPILNHLDKKKARKLNLRNAEKIRNKTTCDNI